ncbi:MAG: NAD-dependent epimerase/dehydratase family protein [Thermodesulfovibrionales bacterium]|jgi:dTDP-glucose 4,6-dehydratase
MELLTADLDYILEHTVALWEEVRNRRIFITGGTGFFGCWLLESFARANERLKLNASALVLTRSPDAFRHRAGHLASHPAIRFHVGDVRSFKFPKEEFSHIIHAATETGSQRNEEDPLLLVDTIVQGTRHTLEFARHCRAKKFLLTSSGAVYGKQPPEVTHVPEDYQGGPDTTDTRSAYGEGKRTAELLCSIYAKQYGLEAKIARCFAFVGPHLPLDMHFAIGNFIRDGMRGSRIYVKGDGKPYRSYLYAADLAVWLWTILFRGKSCQPYNVGSEKDLSIGALARTVANAFQPEREVHISKQAVDGQSAERYVPSTKRIRLELGIKENIDLQEAIKRTILWYSRQVNSGR